MEIIKVARCTKNHRLEDELKHYLMIEIENGDIKSITYVDKVVEREYREQENEADDDGEDEDEGYSVIGNFVRDEVKPKDIVLFENGFYKDPVKAVEIINGIFSVYHDQEYFRYNDKIIEINFSRAQLYGTKYKKLDKDTTLITNISRLVYNGKLHPDDRLPLVSTNLQTDRPKIVKCCNKLKDLVCTSYSMGMPKAGNEHLLVKACGSDEWYDNPLLTIIGNCDVNIDCVGHECGYMYGYEYGYENEPEFECTYGHGRCDHNRCERARKKINFNIVHKLFYTRAPYYRAEYNVWLY